MCDYLYFIYSNYNTSLKATCKIININDNKLLFRFKKSKDECQKKWSKLKERKAQLKIIQFRVTWDQKEYCMVRDALQFVIEHRNCCWFIPSFVAFRQNSNTEEVRKKKIQESDCRRRKRNRLLSSAYTCIVQPMVFFSSHFFFFHSP